MDNPPIPFYNDTGYYGAPYAANPRVEWTYSDKEIFQNSLAELGFGNPHLFEEMSARIPGKTADQVQAYFNALVEAGQIQIPDHNINEATKVEGTRGATSSQGRQKWTEEEHDLFLRGLEWYGKGEWKSISRDIIKSKTPSQVASHAQKYFKRMNNDTPLFIAAKLRRKSRKRPTSKSSGTESRVSKAGTCAAERQRFQAGVKLWLWRITGERK